MRPEKTSESLVILKRQRFGETSFQLSKLDGWRQVCTRLFCQWILFGTLGRMKASVASVVKSLSNSAVKLDGWRQVWLSLFPTLLLSWMDGAKCALYRGSICQSNLLTDKVKRALFFLFCLLTSAILFKIILSAS